MKRLDDRVVVVVAAALAGLPWDASPAAAAGPQPPCAQDPLHCQLPDQLGHGSNNAVGAISDLNPNQVQGPVAAQDNFFTTADGVISAICWWGMYLDFASGDCGPGNVPDSFTVTYYHNVQGFPGSPGVVLAGPFDVTADVTKAATGNIVSTAFGDLAEYEYTATHPAVNVVAGLCLWIEITNDMTGSDPTCVWLWSTAPSVAEGGVGDAVSWQEPPQTENDFDLAFCVDQPLGDPESCDLPFNPGCEGATNICDQETSPDPGCADAECCTLVCLQSAFCCLVEWDQQCVDIAGEVCGLCGQPGTGDCFAADFEPFCDDTCGGQPCIGCCQTVCAVDPACCGKQFGWDGFCTFEAQQLCACTAGSEPPNDDCQAAIPITLGDTPFDNLCASPAGPSHATCNDGFLTGLGLDVWYTYTADFTGQLLVSTCGQINFDSQLAVYQGCGDCDNLSDPPLACNNDGAVCPNGTSLLVVDVVAGTCYLIRVGSSFINPSGSGILTLSADVPPICEITIPPGARPEGEACGDNDNGGCDNEPAPPAFTPVLVEDVIHGTAWASGNIRDTDWYELVLAETTEITLAIEAEFPFVMGLAATNTPGSGDCADTTGFVTPSVTGVTCEQASLTTSLGPGTWWPFVAPSVGDGIPCPVGVGPANDYVLTISAEPPCPGDCNEDGTVGILDFLAVIGEWGSVGTSCDFGVGPPGVGVEEFLQILGNWGPCP